MEGSLLRLLRHSDHEAAGREAGRHVAAAVGGRSDGDLVGRNVSTLMFFFGR